MLRAAVLPCEDRPLRTLFAQRARTAGGGDAAADQQEVDRAVGHPG
jgi:hypothetical protein